MRKEEMKKIDIEKEKVHYHVFDGYGKDVNRPTELYKAPGIENGSYNSDVLYVWQTPNGKELAIYDGIKPYHDDICLCDRCV